MPKKELNFDQDLEKQLQDVFGVGMPATETGLGRVDKPPLSEFTTDTGAPRLPGQVQSSLAPSTAPQQRPPALPSAAPQVSSPSPFPRPSALPGFPGSDQVKMPVPEAIKQLGKQLNVKIDSHMTQQDLSNIVGLMNQVNEKRKNEVELQKAELRKNDYAKIVKQIQSAVTAELSNETRTIGGMQLSQEDLDKRKAQKLLQVAAPYEAAYPGITAALAGSGSALPPPPPGRVRVRYPNNINVPIEKRGKTGPIFENQLESEMAKYGAIKL